MKSVWVLALAAVVLPTSVWAQIAPKNDAWKQDSVSRKDANMTEAQFTQIGNDMVNQFQAYAALHGATLSVNADWNDATVNSSTDEQGTSWVVNTYGGLARRPEIDTDAFKAVFCHELGHNFGGFAFYSDTDWAAAEGQADYFATSVCLPLVWGTDTATNATFRANVPQAVQTACDKAWSDTDRQNLCYRIANAGQHLANLLAALGGGTTPDVTKPDPSIIAVTNVDHPEAQCRLDTYFNGAQCTATFDMQVIPGRNANGGQATKAAQDESAKYTCLGTGTMQPGERPRCWFAPLLQ
jgi:hypothetical protein